jgi:hypothetical protein
MLRQLAGIRFGPQYFGNTLKWRLVIQYFKTEKVPQAWLPGHLFCDE